MNEQLWMTTAEAARYLRIKPATLRDWARTGVVPAHRIPGGGTYRFHARELDQALGLDVEQVARSSGFSDEPLEAAS
jgi:excisionase family DNA binding protein